MKRINFIYSTLFIVCLTIPTYASLPTDRTLDSLLQTVAKQHPDIRAMEQMIAAVKSNETMQRGWMNPMFRVDVMNVPTESYSLEKDAMTMIQFSWMQTIPLNTSAKHRLSQSETKLKDVQKQLMQSEMRRMTIMAYYDLIAGLRNDKILRTGLEQLQNMIKAEQSRIEQGKMMFSDYHLMKAEEATWEQRIAENEYQIQTNKSMLEYLTVGNIDISQFSNELISSIPDVKDLSIQVTSKNPTIQYQQQKISQAEAEWNVARSKLFPEVDVMLSYGYTPSLRLSTSQIDGHSGVTTTENKIIQRTDYVSAGITFPIPVWYRRNQYVEIEMSKSMLSAEKENLRAVTLKEKQAIESDAFLLHSKLEQHQLLINKIIPAKQKTYEQIRLNYESGMTALSELFKIQMEITMSEMDATMLLADSWARIRIIQERLGE